MNISAIKYMYHMTIYNNFMMLIEFKHIITNTIIIHISIFVVSIATNNNRTTSSFLFVSRFLSMSYLPPGGIVIVLFIKSYHHGDRATQCVLY